MQCEGGKDGSQVFGESNWEDDLLWWERLKLRWGRAQLCWGRVQVQKVWSRGKMKNSFMKMMYIRCFWPFLTLVFG